MEIEDDGRGLGHRKEDGWQVIEESLLKMKNTFNEQNEVGFCGRYSIVIMQIYKTAANSRYRSSICTRKRNVLSQLSDASKQSSVLPKTQTNYWNGIDDMKLLSCLSILLIFQYYSISVISPVFSETGLKRMTAGQI